MFRIFVTLAGVAAVMITASPLALAQKLKESPKDEEAKLIAVLKSDAPRKAKADACRELGRVGTREAVPTLAALLGNEELAHMARYGLEPIPDPSVDTALRDALDKVNGRLEVGVIGSIGVRRDPKAVPALVKRLDDSDPEVAQAAARALGKIGDLDAVNALEKSLSQAPEANRIAICEGLFRCADVLRSQGQRQTAQRIYESLSNGNVPEHVKTGARRAAQSVQPRAR
jgi:HEAT repeat protein